MMKDRDCVAITQHDNKRPAALGATDLVLSEKRDKVAGGNGQKEGIRMGNNHTDLPRGDKEDGP